MEKYELIKYMFEQLDNPSKRLTEWEQNFIASVSDQFDRKGTLSDRQFEILEKIYAEKTS